MNLMEVPVDACWTAMMLIVVASDVLVDAAMSLVWFQLILWVKRAVDAWIRK